MDLINKVTHSVSNFFSLKSSPTKSNNKLMVDLVKAQRDLWRKEINHFQNARAMRYSVEEPRTWELMECYKDSMMDTNLTSITNNRILRILNKSFVVVDKNGVNEDLTKQICEDTFFHLFIRKSMESIFWGYSMLYLPDGSAENGVEIPREHVLPEQGYIVREISDAKGLAYKDFPKHFIYLQMYDSIGLLEKALPMTILKRHSWASWDEFEQMFGVPIRVAKMMTNDTKAKKEVFNWLKKIGQSGSAVLPSTVDVDIKESTQKDAFGVFLEKIKEVDDQLRGLINGQTMTTGSGSSRSQSETHLKTEGEITKADLKRVLQLINQYLKTVYQLPEGTFFDVITEVDIKEQIKIDEVILKHGYRLKRDYIERTYGSELEEEQDEKEPEDDTTSGKKKA